MLTLLPCAPGPLMPIVARAEIALRDAGDHPDAALVQQIIDTLDHALMRANELGAQCEDARVREAVVSEPHGVASCLSDAVSDLAYALECWADGREDRAHRDALDWQRMVREA